MKYFFLIIWISFCHIANGSESKQLSIKATDVNSPHFVLGMNSQGQFALLSTDGTKVSAVPRGFFKEASLGLFEKAKEMACDLEIKPETVSASAGVISFTWNINELCKK